MSYSFAAVNFNSRRRPGTPYNERQDGKLGSVYTLLTEVLLRRPEWRRKLAEREGQAIRLPKSFHLLLGTAQGKGIPWGRYYLEPGSMRPLVNCAARKDQTRQALHLLSPCTLSSFTIPANTAPPRLLRV